jgi:hypothetical protein
MNGILTGLERLLIVCQALALEAHKWGQMENINAWPFIKVTPRHILSPLLILEALPLAGTASFNLHSHF